MTPPLVEVAHLGYTYPDGTAALKDVTFSIAAGEKVALLGPTGSGKSTLLLHLIGLVLADRGRVVVDGLTVSASTARAVRSRVGLVFQEPDDQLFLPSLLEDVAFGPLNDGCPPAEAEAGARRTLAELGLAGSENRPAHHLSGGEKRLAALATVLVSHPPLLALDEPTSNLDARGKRRLVGLIRGRNETLLVATHDLSVAEALCVRAVVLTEGRLAYDGVLRDLLGDPASLEAFGLTAGLD